MKQPHLTESDWEQAQTTLGVNPAATGEQIHAAYLRELKLHPPDRDPEAFERIRNAYDLLRDPRARARQVVKVPDPGLPLASILANRKVTPRHVGVEPWLAVLEEKKS